MISSGPGSQVSRTREIDIRIALGPPREEVVAMALWQNGRAADVPLILLAVALAASYLPALRASRIKPISALRCE
jgi:ABC-type antimicrobial peptide transport system permease subunit